MDKNKSNEIQENVSVTEEEVLKDDKTGLHVSTMMPPPTTTIVPKSIKTKIIAKHKCPVCDESFLLTTKLWYHIRLKHFNLKPIVPICETKEVGEIWFEKVKNTDLVAQIK
ncbi:unnamed protein product, partial [Leptidea sinapis]